MITIQTAKSNLVITECSIYYVALWVTLTFKSLKSKRARMLYEKWTTFLSDLVLLEHLILELQVGIGQTHKVK